MRKTLLLLLVCIVVLCTKCFAQRGMKVWKDGKYELVYLSESDSVTFFEGNKMYGEWGIDSITGIPLEEIPDTGGTYTLKATASRTVKQSFNDGSAEYILPNEIVEVTSFSVKGGEANISGNKLTVPGSKSKTPTQITVTASFESKTLSKNFIQKELPDYWYMGKITKTRTEFADLSIEKLLEVSTPIPVTQKTYEFIIDESIWFVLLPEDSEPELASYDAGIVSYSPEDEIKDSNIWKATHSDIEIEGKKYKIYGYRNTAFVGTSWITANFTIK